MAAASSHASPWAGRWNAEVYDAFTREHRIYRALNRKLVALARVDAARRVLDLACGAGATAQACLERLPARGELVGVDGSTAMVEVARTRIGDPRARFAVASASGFEAVVAGRFDRAVCNAAFWQFPDRRAVLAALARRLEPRGLLVFNVPEERLAPEDEPGDERAESGPGTPVTPFQVALARAVEERTGRPPAGPPPLDTGRLESRLREAGFTPIARERFTYAGRQRELMELMTIPAMIGRLAPGLSPTAREEVLDRARRHVDPDQPVRIPWIYCVARREEPEPQTGGADPAGRRTATGLRAAVRRTGTAQATDRPLRS